MPADQQKRKLLFRPLETKEALHDWIQLFLGFDIPDSLVDEQSNCTPMESIWYVYDKCRRNDDENFNRVLSYASRMSFKTLGASILEVLMVFHLGRSVAHMAAIEPQAKKSQEYVKRFLRQPILREFVVGNNQRKVEIVRYEHKKTRHILSPKEWKDLPTGAEQDQYEMISYYITIVICTMQGANSEHVPFMVVDEVDVVSNPAAYEEAKAIPDTFEGKMPVTLLTSTRKFAFGLVQNEIKEAHKTGLHVKHWNILDVTERCPDKRHRPDLPKLPIYRSDETLRALSEKEFEDLPDEQKLTYVKDEGFAGCIQNCKLFAVCKGRLATHQKSVSPLLKKIPQTQQQFASFSPQMAKAQLLCWKPSTEGLVYPRLDRSVHMLSAAQIAEKITGEPHDPKMSKRELIAMLMMRDVQWFAGMDWGYTHNFATVIGVKDGSRMFVIDVISQAELDLGQTMDICEKRLKPYDPVIFPDPAYPANIKAFKRSGFKMRDWDKYKGSVVGGIEVVRLKLWPAIGRPELFFLAEDEGVNFLFERMQEYNWKTDAAGRVTDQPNDEKDDECDALRYMVMNVFAPKGKIVVPREESSLTIKQAQQPQYHQESWASQIISESVSGYEEPLPDTKPRGRRGKLIWDM